MADAWAQTNPRLADYLAAAGGDPIRARMLQDDAAYQAAQQPQQGTYTPTGNGNFLTAGLGAGWHGGLSELASGGEGLARSVGLSSLADAAKRWSDTQRQEAATYQRPDLEGPNAPAWYNPSEFGYTLAKSVPATAAMLAAAPAIAPFAPEWAVGGVGAGLAAILGRAVAPKAIRAGIGGAVAAYPFSVGSNVQRAEAPKEEGGGREGSVTQGSALEALGLGVPEAAMFGFPAERFAGAWANGVGGKVASRFARGAVQQAPYMTAVSGAQEALTQLMGDPDRSFADRAKGVVDAALGGGLQGAFFGGAIGAVRPALAKKPTADVTTPDLDAATAKVLDPSKAPPPPAPEAPPQMVPDANSPEFRDYIDQLHEAQRVIPEAQPLGIIPDNVPEIGNRSDMYEAAEQAFGNKPLPELNGLVKSLERVEAPSDTQAQRLELAKAEQERRASPPAEAPPEPIPPTEAAVTAHGAQPPDAPPAPSGPYQFPWDAPRENEKIKALSLAAFLRRAGGVQDQTGELRNYTKEYPGLVNNKKGLSPDAAAQMAAEAGYFGGDTTRMVGEVTPADLYDMLREHPSYSVHDQQEVMRAQDAAARNLDLDRLRDHAKEVEDFAKENGLVLSPEDLDRSAKLWHSGEYQNVDDAIKGAAHQLGEEDADAVRRVTVEASGGSQDLGGRPDESNPEGGNARGQEALAGPSRQVPDRSENAGNLATEAGPQGTRQTLIPGVEPVTDRQRANLEASKPLRGGNAPMDDGLFGGPLPDELFAKGGYNPPRTPIDRDLSQKLMNGASTRALLQHAADNHPNPEIAEYARFLLKNGDLDKTQIGFAQRPTKGMPLSNDRVDLSTAPATYSRSQNRINIYDPSDITTSLLHEATHAATQPALDGNTSGAQEVKSIFNRVKERSAGNDAYGLTDVHEFVAEAMSNPKFREFLKGETWATGSQIGDMWRGVKNAVFKMLRMPERVRTAFDQVMEQMPGLMKESGEVRAQGVRGVGGELPSAPPSPEEGVKETVKAGADIGGRVVSAVSGNLGNVKSNLGDKILEHGMKWLHTDQIAHLYSHIVPSLKDYYARITGRDARSEAASKVDRVAARMWGDLDKTQSKLMGKITEGFQYGIDPRKPWASPEPGKPQLGHDYLHGDDNAAEWRQYHNDRVNDLNNLLRTGPKALEALNNAVATNEFKMHGRNALLSHMLVKAVDQYDKAIGSDPAFATNPIEDFVQMSREHDDPVAAAKWMGERSADMYGKLRGLTDTLGSQADALKQEMAARRKEMGKKATKASFAEAEVNYQKLRSAADNLKSLVSSINQAHEAWDRAPNFSLGHGDGNFFASGNIKFEEDGLASKQTIAAIQDALNKAGFGNVSVERLNKNSQIFARVNTQRQADALGKVFLDLQERGFLDKDKDVQSGPNKEPSAFEGVMPAFAHKIMEVVRQSMPEPPEGASNQERPEYDRQLQDMQRQMLDLLPETSLTRAWTSRKMAQGYTPDMQKAFNNRNANESRGLATLSSSRDIAAALSGMRDELKGLKGAATPMKQKMQAQRAVEEIMQREAQRQWMLPTPGVDLIQRLTHILEIGISPAYFVTLMSQIPTLSLPELGDKHGYAKASAALIRNTGKTFAVVKAALGGPEAATFGVRLQELEKQKVLSKADVDFILKFANMGGLNQSAFTSAMTGHHELSEGIDRVLNWGSTMSLTSEMIPRIITAFAARDLYNEKPVKGFATPEDYALNAANGSQFDFNPANSPRAFGKHGPMGPAGKLTFQFMGFVTLLSEKMYREMSDAFGRPIKGEKPEDTAARQREARLWLGGHAAAVAAIAGTMGLPGANMLTGVFDKLADWATGEDSWDSQLMYRRWLGSVFGPQAGEVIARGLPRAAGLDMSHEGEGDMLDRIMPFMQLLTEKRKFEDNSDDFLRHMSGSAFGMARNMILGGRDMMNGDYLRGAIKMAPEALKGPLEAAQIAERGGYPVGRMQLPDPRLHPGTGDLAAIALGLSPRGEAEANLDRREVLGLNAMQQYRAENIANHLAMAQARGDQPNMQYWMGDNAAFMREHPGVTPPVMQFGQLLRQAMQQQAMSAATGAPPGIGMRNIAERNQFNFGN